MERKNESLFQIGEVAKALGVSRRMILNYEEQGLLTPDRKNPDSGFRYYSADNMVHIRLIRALQNLGLSLGEIKEYFGNSDTLGEQIDRLVLLRNQLDQYIAQLRLRQAKASQNDIKTVTLPAFTGFCREFKNANLAQKTDCLRKTYIEAVKNYKIDTENKMCTQCFADDENSGLYIIPVEKQSRGENIKVFHQTQCICIYYRGAYEDFPKIHRRLLDYAKEKGMTPHGYFRNIYMEGPPTHGEDKQSYITQIALPIKFISPAEKK